LWKEKYFLKKEIKNIFWAFPSWVLNQCLFHWKSTPEASSLIILFLPTFQKFKFWHHFLCFWSVVLVYDGFMKWHFKLTLLEGLTFRFPDINQPRPSGLDERGRVEARVFEKRKARVSIPIPLILRVFTLDRVKFHLK
jgi:hypothetical protein